MDASGFDRAVAFLAGAARRQAARVVDVPGGFAVLNPDLAASYMHNKLVVTGPAAPADVVAAADAVLGGAGMGHRMVEVHYDDVDPRAFASAGYQPQPNVVMRHSGAAPDRAADPAVAVEAMDLETMIEDGRREWRDRYPDAADADIEQLARRRAAILRAADEVTFLGVRDAGTVVARADLYLDRSGVAQIESVLTDPEYQGRGLARALVLDGLRRARAAGAELVFLVADADDWPRRLYGRLGFVPVGRTHEFLRPSAHLD
jgi:GNAT superfamily N-acetyltransferase